jgi:hypothetical protein
MECPYLAKKFQFCNHPRMGRGEIASQVQKTEVDNATDVVGVFDYFQISHSMYLKYLHSLFYNAIPVQVSSLYHHYTHLRKFNALHFQIHWS